MIVSVYLSDTSMLLASIRMLVQEKNMLSDYFNVEYERSRSEEDSGYHVVAG